MKKSNLWRENEFLSKRHPRGGKAMLARTASRKRPTSFLMVLLLMSISVGVAVPATAGPGSGGGGGHGGGGGGGHGGGGHGGGGHGGGGHSGGHGSSSHSGGGHGVAGRMFGWMHLGSRNHAPRANGAADEGLPFTSGVMRSARRPQLPSTFIRRMPANPLPAAGERRFSQFRRRPNFAFGWRRHFPRGGCYFNGYFQQCIFEPGPGLFFGDFGFDPFWWDSCWDSDWNDAGYLCDGDGMEADATPAGEMDDATAAGDAATGGAQDAGEPPGAGDASWAALAKIDPKFYVLILKSGGQHIVSDYWLADGYLEYVSRDGTRSHIPIAALDLQGTVTVNSRRGLTFVLRSAPKNPE